MYDRPSELARPLGNAVEKSSSPVRDLISRLEDRLKALHAGYDALEERLDTVLRPVPPATAQVSRGGETSAPEAHLVGRLRFLNEAADALDQRFQHLHSRIEL